VISVHRDVERTLSGDDHIYGLAVMNNELYVGRQCQSVIEVYDVTTLSFRRSLSIPGLQCVLDMASCPECDVVYISDQYTNMINAINESGDVVFSWSVVRPAWGLSVNSQLNVVVVAIFSEQLQLFTLRGEFLRSLYLHPSITYMWQGIQLDDDRYVVVHGTSNTGLNRVCIVNGNGGIIQSYGRNEGSGIGQLYQPLRMLLFGGSLIVADRHNDRVVLFDVSPLTYVRELISTRDTQSQPYRLAISDDGTRLFVAYEEELRTFNMTWI
jgi:DNA-binding beta-propeller fold protein YncE